MAERIQVELVDDIDGSPAQHTVTFALDGVMYEIDLSEHHARQLRSVFTQYIDHARKPEGTTGQTRQQERADRQTRQANRRLTEQIRGAAQRTRERLKEQEETAEQEAEQATPEPLPLASERLAGHSAPAPHPDSETDESETERPAAVSLPQFSAAE